MADKLTNNTGFSNKGCSDGNDSSLQKYLILSEKYSHVRRRLVFKFLQQKKKNLEIIGRRNLWGNIIRCMDESMICE